MRRASLWVPGLALLLASGVDAQALPCRQALALALDVSGSVDALEYRQQLDGLITAFGAAPVRRVLFAHPGAPVDVMIYEWSGPDDVAVLVEWRSLATPADLDILQETIRQTRRREASPGTALGFAMQHGLTALSDRADCWKRTLDVSGDGKSNLGIEPTRVRSALLEEGITVNALVIGADAPHIGDLRQADIAELSAYFQRHVIAGPDAFVQTALGYGAYADAMARKLERELSDALFSDLDRRRGTNRPGRRAAADAVHPQLGSDRVVRITQ